ncbi:proton-coupled amino acid transporter-like protein pathetic [Phymastichus coffea]|uniref:proton-coupled amino acid transporter-like protein pathetic n=1 Tax=Phymastichus coffea TaxID=108790 RepID=UPI00273C98E5|nr:proton-coupled amino acid transporter-like protein pathetic [Phymastichus coffea]
MDNKDSKAQDPGTVDFNSTTTIVISEKTGHYEPSQHRDSKHATSNFGAAAHLIKASLGSGILAMPAAVKNGGLLFGGIGVIVIGIVCSHCVHILVRSSQVLCRKTRSPHLDYPETAAAAFEFGPKPLRRFSGFVRSLVSCALVATQVGVTCTYVVLIAGGIKQLGNYYFHVNVDLRLYIAIIIPVLVFFGQIRHLKMLVPFSLLANAFMSVSFAMILWQLCQKFKPLDELHYIADWDKIPKFFATVIFAIEGIGTVMSIENSMSRPQQFLGCPNVLNVSMTVVIALYAAMGILGYLNYGETAEGSISNNLPIETAFGQTVKILISLAIAFTYGLQFFVPLEIISNAVKQKLSHKYQCLGETGVRVCMVMLTVIVAVAVPTLEPFISLVGAVFFSFLGVCIPAIVETVSCWDGHLGFGYWRIWKNVVLVLFSMLALSTGTWVSVLDIIDQYTKTA